MWYQHTQYSLFPPASLEAEHQPKAEQNGTVHNIPEHDSEHEGEGDASEQSWVGFLVPRNTVSFDNFLRRAGEAVGLEEGGILACLVLDELAGGGILPLQLGQQLPHIIEVLVGNVDPALDEVVE